MNRSGAAGPLGEAGLPEQEGKVRASPGGLPKWQVATVQKGASSNFKQGSPQMSGLLGLPLSVASPYSFSGRSKERS